MEINIFFLFFFFFAFSLIFLTCNGMLWVVIKRWTLLDILSSAKNGKVYIKYWKYARYKIRLHQFKISLKSEIAKVINCWVVLLPQLNIEFKAIVYKYLIVIDLNDLCDFFFWRGEGLLIFENHAPN